MIFLRRPRRRKRDILELALKYLGPEEELVCTNQTYENLSERLDSFRTLNPEHHYVAISCGVTKKIKRLA